MNREVPTPKPEESDAPVPTEPAALSAKTLTTSARISFGIMAVLLVLIAWLHLGTLILTAMFGYFAMHLFSLGRSKALGVVLYLVAVVAIATGLFFFSKRAYKTLPEIADTTIPAVVNFAEHQGIELPFADYDSLKTVARQEVAERLTNVGTYARAATLQLAMLLIGVVVAVSLFINAKWEVEDDPDAVKNSLYATVVRELILRFTTFFRSFARVIGAQIIISIINTAMTAIFLVWNGFQYATVIIVLTFLCGLLPIIGNLLSNALIIGVAFTVSPDSPKLALIALIFLVAIHKLEYFLNSKIIGDRIKNPMWLTLIGLVLGEKLMGIPGIILAPVVLHYIKVEASRNKAADEGADAVKARPTK
jgi:predicted PurR-regulated permease PerM